MRDISARAHSNESLSFIGGNDNLKVLKIFSTNLYRAQQNIDKQKNFFIKDDLLQIDAAPIISCANDNLSISLTMPYIEGYSGEDFAIYGSKDMARNISHAFSRILEYEVRNSTEALIKKDIFIHKMEEVLDSTSHIKTKKFYCEIKKILERAPDVMLIPIGSCHGDLTLGNLIYQRDQKITLIDFLHTYLESPLQDIAKLNQEYKYCWSFRKCSSPLLVKGKIFLASAFPEMINIIYQKYSLQSKIFELVNLLRIGPYLRDDLTCDWLVKSLQDSIEECKK